MRTCRTVHSSRARLSAVDSCCSMRKGLAVLGLSLIGVMTFDLVGPAPHAHPTITSTVNCGIGTTCTATYTIFNTSALPLAFAVLYAYGPTPAGSTVNNLPAWIPAHSASAFTVTDIARSAKTYSIDILVGHTTVKSSLICRVVATCPAAQAIPVRHRRHHSLCSLLPAPILALLLSRGPRSLVVVGSSCGPHTVGVRVMG